MIKRERYLNFLIDAIDNEFVKVITGVRRSGKSVLLMQVQDALRERGITDDQIVYLNFESFSNAKYLNNPERLYDDLMQRNQGKKLYFFFDEIQLVSQWQMIVNSLRVDLPSDIYITGSNASILSGELATLLSGRYVQINVYPFSFAEFVELKEIDTSSVTSMRDAYLEYREFGGMPSILDANLSENQRFEYLSNLYDSIMLRDVSQRSGEGNQQLLKMLTLVMLDSISSEVSVSKLVNRLKDAGFNINTTRFRNYVGLLEQAYLFISVPRLNLRGSQRLRSNDKFYVIDNGLWHSQVGDAGTNIGSQLENIVCLELMRRGFDVKYGEIDGKEIDFVAEKRGQRQYVQVTQQIPENSEREVANLVAIPDGYPKLLITGEDLGVKQIDGVPVVPIYEWLLSE